MALVALSDVKTHLEISGSGYDTVLTTLGTGVQARFDIEVGYTLEAPDSDTTVYYDSDGGDCLVLQGFPVVSVTSVTIDTDRGWSGDALSSDYYFLDQVAGILWWTNYTPTRAKRSIKVVHLVGYDTDTFAVPDELARAYLAQVKHEFDNRDEMSDRLIQDSTGNKTEPIGFRLLPDVMSTLKRYKRHWL